MGRKKIPIEKIDDKSKRNATFKKRSHGALKKAQELAVLCDVDVALVISSPNGKLQHFPNQPEIQQVIQRFNQYKEEDMANLQVPKDTDTVNGINIATGQDCVNDQQSPDATEKEMSIQEPQAGNEAGVSGSKLPRWFAEAIMASQEGEQLQMQGMRDPSSSSSSVRPSVPSSSSARRYVPSSSSVRPSVPSSSSVRPSVPSSSLVRPSVPSSSSIRPYVPSSSSVRPSVPSSSSVRPLVPSSSSVRSSVPSSSVRPYVPSSSSVRPSAPSSSSVGPSVPGQDTSELRGPLSAAEQPSSSSDATLPRWLREALASRGGER